MVGGTFKTIYPIPFRLADPGLFLENTKTIWRKEKTGERAESF